MEETTPAVVTDKSVRNMFGALKYPSCRSWYFGLLFSLVGYWMAYQAMCFFVFEVTGSAAYLGYTGFALGLPAWLFTLFGGVVADRIPRRRVILVTLAYFMALIAALTVLTFSGGIQPWHILLFSLGLGFGYAFNGPAIQSFVADLVERKDLPNAVALNSLLFNIEEAITPALLGLLYAGFGPAWVFALCSFLFLPGILVLQQMALTPGDPLVNTRSPLAQLRDGIRYIMDDKTISVLLLVLGIYSMLAVVMVVLTPAWAVNVLGGDVRTNGLMNSVRGVGAITGGLTAAALSHRAIRGRVMSVCMLLTPLIVLLFTLVRAMPLVLLFQFLEGCTFIIFSTMVNSMIQSQVQESLRGRVMSVYALIVFGGLPVGSLIGGMVADSYGEPAAVTLAAAGMMAVAVWTWLRRPALRSLS